MLVTRRRQLPPQLGYAEDTEQEDVSRDDVERASVEYLSKHRQRLDARLRLEIEKRNEEHTRDEEELKRRQEALRAGAAPINSPAGKPAGALRKPGPQTPFKPPPVELPGIYVDVASLSVEQLRLVAQQQSVDELAPLNTRGKYHTRYMKDKYPIAGTQFKLERERELCIGAKKRLLLLKDSKHVAGSVWEKGKGRSGDRSLAQLPYRKLHFYIDKMSDVLRAESDDVAKEHAHRQIRLVGVEHQEGLEAFWGMLMTEHKREVIAWLKNHTFRDVNVAVTIGSDNSIHPNKDVGMTPLMAACRALSVGLVHGLLEQGADVNLTTANGDTAMHFIWRDWEPPKTTISHFREAADTAIRANQVYEILQALLSHGADVNAQNLFGESALQFCALHGLEDCVKLLIEHDADVNAVDRQGRNSVAIAQELNYDQLYRLLLNHQTIQRVRKKEHERRRDVLLLRQKRGTLTADWTESTDKLFARLAVLDRRAGHLRNQYVDRHGNVVVDDSDDEDEDEPKPQGHGHK
ncbi:TPA: hypothetical protein N0F65_005146 [Lagenidium giganteum]|uniref:Uncharacterized protein n=1 Tax=Lagenidium giganteum TaxID=4803 RepID=A0AAV2YXS7_9STRA|nr:TPA: hypothetical protein N0F65_005146 [Lagenidium giganteum]